MKSLKVAPTFHLTTTFYFLLHPSLRAVALFRIAARLSLQGKTIVDEGTPLGPTTTSLTTIHSLSMLVSPIMGPVVGLAYGTTISDWKLVRLSLKNEIISLVFCIVVGVAIAAIAGVTELADDWPTAEMKSRAMWANFIVALPVAFFSGLGVAVSLLDDQTSSLVGVAISASLLPPAVNAGILWIYYAYTERGKIDQGWTDDDQKKLVGGGIVSLLLTIANIVLIWVSSMLMFRMKEVLPMRAWLECFDSRVKRVSKAARSKLA